MLPLWKKAAVSNGVDVEIFSTAAQFQARIDEFVMRGAATMNAEAREGIWREAIGYYAEQVPMIQLVQYLNTWAHRRGLVHDPRMDERTIAMGVRPAR